MSFEGKIKRIKVHDLKTIQPHFEDMWNEEKRAEIRFNDRRFEVGDIVYLQEYDSEKQLYSRREIRVLITHILSDFEGLKDGWVMFSFDILDKIDKSQTPF